MGYYTYDRNDGLGDISDVNEAHRPARSTIGAVSFATIAMVLALMWPTFEGTITSLLRH